MLKAVDVFNNLDDFSYDYEQMRTKLKKLVEKNDRKIIILDDDPTGSQTISDLTVYTYLDRKNIHEALKNEKSFFVLTNSRSFTKEETESYHENAGKIISDEAMKQNVDYLIISRSDSTLRGHFPTETRVLRDTIEKYSDKVFDGEILIPFFKEGGRFTIDDEHYVLEKDELKKAVDTEFAKDRSFSYSNSNMYKYIEEKTGGEFRKEEITSITLKELRRGDVSGIKDKLMAVKNFEKVFVNCQDYRDLTVFCTALWEVLDSKNFILRTAASFIREFLAMDEKRLLEKEDLVKKKGGGIIAVGSHTKKTTEQLDNIRDMEGLEMVEFNSDLADNEEELLEEIDRVSQKLNEILKRKKTAVIYTKREYFKKESDSREDELIRSVLISKSLSHIVSSVKEDISFVLAKGGITSADVAIDALRLKKAKVLGQILPGVPVWQTPADSKFAGISFIIFPGNVGDKDSLKNAVKKLI